MEYHDYRIDINSFMVSLTNKDGHMVSAQISGNPSWSESNCTRIYDLKSRVELGTATQDDFKELGTKLYHLIFSGPNMLSHFWEALQARSAIPNCILRIRLVIDPYFNYKNLGRLGSLPWSIVYQEPQPAVESFYFAKHPKLVLIQGVRTDSSSLAIPKVQRRKKIRVSVVVSCPSDLGSVLSKQGVQAVKDSLNSEDFGIEILQNPTDETLVEHLEFHQPEILHFLGHGRFVDSVAEIALTDETGLAVWVNAEDFVALLHSPDIKLPRLVCLIACEGAAESSTAPFASFAPHLAGAGVEGVIAMLYEISNVFGLEFTKKLYGKIARHGDVAAALQRARFTATLQYNKGREFAAPLLIGEQVVFSTLAPPPDTVSVSDLRDIMRTPEPVDLFGRNDEERTLLESLMLEGVSFVWGEGGVGKSALARSVARQFAKEKGLEDSHLWIDCSDVDQRIKCVRSIIRARPGDIDKSNELVIFDGLDELPREVTEELLGWLKNAGRLYRVLITSRVRFDKLGPFITKEPLHLSELNPAAAAQLFRARARVANWEDGQGIRDLVQVNALVHSICESVGNLPLGIEILASKSGYRPLTELLSDAWKDLNKLTSSQTRTLAAPWHYSINACFSRTFNSLSDEAKTLLHTFCYVDKVNSLVIDAFAAANARESTASEDSLSGLHVQELVDKSVWRRINNDYTMHPLMRRYALLGATVQLCPHSTACGLNPTHERHKTSSPA